jgi:hypothetical protein
MTPKEKARDLILKHLRVNHGFNVHIARQCALIAVYECIELLLNINPHMVFPQQVEYWQKVKQELEKI